MKKTISFVCGQSGILLHFSLICILTCNSRQLKATDLFFQAGAREAGLANSSVALGGTWSVFHNPAGMVSISSMSIGFNYENRYAIKELVTSSFAGIIPVRFGNFGFSGSYFGSSRYSEQKYAFGYSRSFAGKIDVGILCDYLSVNLPEGYDTPHSLAGEIGIIAHPIEYLAIGCHLFNLTSQKFNNSILEVPIIFRTGAAWETKNYLISSQIQLNEKEKPVLSVGSEITFFKKLAMRMGISTCENMNYTLGLGYTNSWIKGDFALAHHSVLGYSACISFEFTGILHKR